MFCLWWTRTFSVKMCDNKHIDSFSWGSGSSPSLALSPKCETHRRFATSDVLTTSSLDHFPEFDPTGRRGDTNKRTYPSWTRLRPQCLRIYALCCRTCPNTNTMLTICFAFSLITHFRSRAPSHWIRIYCLSSGPWNPHVVVDLKC